MSLSTSLLAFTDCTALYDAALADSRGARLDFTTQSAAQYFISRMHQARKLHREFNAEVHARGSRFHGRSVYDSLVCRIKPGAGGDHMIWWVYVEHGTVRTEGFQKLSEVEDEQLLLVREPPRLMLPAPQAQGIKRRV